MFSYFEKLIDPYRVVPLDPPPAGLWAFFWHYIRPVWPLRWVWPFSARSLPYLRS